MKRTVGACIVVAALCGAGLTGCGGSADDAVAAPTGAVDDDSGDFVARAEALCRHLAVRFAGDLRTALSDTDHLAEAADANDPGSLAPTFAAAEAGFGRAIALVDLLRSDFDRLHEAEAPDGGVDALEHVERSLATLRSMLVGVRDAAVAQDQAAFASALGHLQDVDRAQLDDAARRLAAVGATDCLPAA